MALFSKILSRIRGGSVSASDWNELRVSLIEADLGVVLSDELIKIAQSNRSEGLEVAITSALQSSLSKSPRTLALADSRPTTILVVGVNGTGKTTSVAKLMYALKREGRSVLVAAADTFRAAAIEQLQTWGERIGVPIVAGKFQGDSASVVFDAVKQAAEGKVEFLIVDTAGRLHTKSNLMEELTKIRRVLEKSGGVDEVLLVIDATTGQNGIIQAQNFMQSVAVTGIPIKFVGSGEGFTDFAVFDSDSYILGLIGS
jgi:fused signal recognition particle receptor